MDNSSSYTMRIWREPSMELPSDFMKREIEIHPGIIPVKKVILLKQAYRREAENHLIVVRSIGLGNNFLNSESSWHRFTSNRIARTYRLSEDSLSMGITRILRGREECVVIKIGGMIWDTYQSSIGEIIEKIISRCMFNPYNEIVKSNSNQWDRQTGLERKNKLVLCRSVLVHTREARSKACAE